MSQSSGVAPPLQGIQVVDFSHTLPGPYCTQLLADLGARVVKIERPGGGDYLRSLMPAVFAHYNRGKKSVSLDLKDPDDRGRALELIEKADVVVEGFRPGVMARFGLDAATIRQERPDIIYCSISGWGQEGELRDAPGHDLNYLGAAGALHDPVSSSVGAQPTLLVADLASGSLAAIAITGAIIGRQRTGVGATIDLSMADIALTWAAASHVSGVLNPRSGSESSPAHGIFLTKDGQSVTLGTIEDHFWHRFVDIADEPRLRDSRFETHQDRNVAYDELRDLIQEVIGTRTADDWISAAEANNVPIFIVSTFADAIDARHFLDRGIVRRSGDSITSAFPALWDGTLLSAGDEAPELDEHAQTAFSQEEVAG